MGEAQVLKRIQIAVIAAIAALAMGFTLSLGTTAAYADDGLQAGGTKLHTLINDPDASTTKYVHVGETKTFTVKLELI